MFLVISALRGDGRLKCSDRRLPQGKTTVVGGHLFVKVHRKAILPQAIPNEVQQDPVLPDTT
jgi:hypothetical protein